MQKVTLFIVCLFVSAFSFSQINEDAALQQQLQGKTKFYDIRATVDEFYKQKFSLLSPVDSLKRKKLNRKTKMWNRWFYESESRLNDNVEVENFTKKIYEYQNANSNSPLTSQGSWSHIGPNSVAEGIGRINRIAVDPSVASTIYAGSSGGGLYKTTNAGISWTNVDTYLPSLGISGIVLTNSNTIYILTGDGDGFSGGGFISSYGYIRYSVGVLKSTDGGNTWVQTAAFPGLANERYCGMRLVRDPNNANVLMAATTHGLFRTSDGGNSWTLCPLGNSDDNVIVYDVRFAPGSSTFVYCSIRSNNNSTEGAFLRSTDGGITFPSSNTVTYSPNNIINIERIGIGVTPANPDLVYLITGPGNESGSIFKGLWKSTDKGATFTRQSNTPDVLGAPDFPGYGEQNMYDMAIAVSPTNANIVIVAGLVIFKSESAGILFGQATPYHGSASIHPDVHDLVYVPSNGYLYVASDGGVSVSSDNGSTWSKLFNGLSCTQFYHFEPSNEDSYVWGGAQDNGILIRQGTSSTFDRFYGGDGYDVLTDAAPAGNNNDKWWVSNKSIYSDGAITTEVTPGDVDIDASKNYFPNLAMSPTNEDVLYAGYPSLYVSYSRGSNWAKFESPDPPLYYIPGNWSISTCPTNRKRIYTAGNTRDGVIRKGLWRIDNLDDVIPDVVTELTANLKDSGYHNDNPKITDIAVSSNSSNRLWATVGDFYSNCKVFYSNNGGSNWTNISGSLPNFPVNTIVADDNDNVYIGTDFGVYYKGVNEADWTPFYNGLPRVAVSELKFWTYLGITNLYAATYGRGIWVSEIFSNCVPTLSLSNNIVGPRFYQASSTINSSAVIDGSIGTNVFLRSGVEINLTAGTEVKPGAALNAYIGPCNTGPVPVISATGDSVITITKNITSARQYGFVHDAKINGENVNVTLNIFNSGSYTIRLFDTELKAYTTAITVNPAKGYNSFTLPFKIVQGKYYRADLFKENMLVHYMDVEGK